ncbi:MAG: nucleotidyltransferase domain-containing protein [Clostridiales bacterium]|jgi:hypothetical protein|nr:nucleotidyltransferase domain-containing protein [Clostridiales bacterium]
MEEYVRKSLLAKNKKIIDMVIERAKRDFPDDIGLIGLTGSFSHGDYHEHSDLDLIIVNVTEQGWGISYCFILDDVGYDIYCTPWEPRLASQSKVESSMVSCLLDMEILYVAKPEYMDKLNAYRQAALDELVKPIGKPCLDRAAKHIDQAKQEYANAMLAEEIGMVRYAVGGVIYNTINAIVSMNNTYIKRGARRWLEELRGYSYLPKDFEMNYMAVIDGKTVDEMRRAAFTVMKSLIKLHEEMIEKFVEKPTPTYENLRGTYEELWCNCRNKIIRSTDLADKNYAFHAAFGAQNYLDEMTEVVCGTPKFDLMSSFDSGDLQTFKATFLRTMDEYLDEYKKVGRKVERFDKFEDLYSEYMKITTS